MTFAPVEVIEVRAWGGTVGAVAPDPGSGGYAFEYDAGWAAGAVQLSPLRIPNGPAVFTFPELDPVTFLGLPPFVADALPDRFGNALIDAWMASQGVDPGLVTPLDRLAYTADRAMGALEFRPPAEHPTPDATAIALAQLVTAARTALRGTVADGPEAEASLETLISVGTSAGGARAKAVIAFNPQTYEIRSGQLAAPDGFEHWLVKLDGVGTDPTREETLVAGEGYGKVEFAYHLMAAEAGVEMAECRLLPEGPRTHFLTKRFDRVGGAGRVHLLSLCGLDHLDFNQAGAHGYEQYLAAIARLGLGEDALEQAFRRIVFNVAAVNCDDHTKNVAFLCDEAGSWRLAPAYDVTFAWNPGGRWTSAHQMTVDGKREGIGVSELLAIGERFRVPARRAVIGDVLSAVDHWSQHAEAAEVDEERASAIGDAHRIHRPR